MISPNFPLSSVSTWFEIARNKLFLFQSERFNRFEGKTKRSAMTKFSCVRFWNRHLYQNFHLRNRFPKSLHPDWFIVRLVFFFPILLFSCFSLFKLLHFYAVVSFVDSQEIHFLFVFLAIITLTVFETLLLLTWFSIFFRSKKRERKKTHSTDTSLITIQTPRCICRFNQKRDEMARVMETQYDSLEQHIEFARKHKNPRWVVQGSAADEMNTFLLSSSRLSNYLHSYNAKSVNSR